MSSSPERRSPAPRSYPPFYERAVPLALGVIGVTVTIMLLITVGILLGLF